MAPYSTDLRTHVLRHSDESGVTTDRWDGMDAVHGDCGCGITPLRPLAHPTPSWPCSAWMACRRPPSSTAKRYSGDHPLVFTATDTTGPPNANARLERDAYE